MRPTHNLGLPSLKSNLRLFWDRITFSRLTTIYFTFSVVHFIIQVTLQFRAFSINAHAATFLNSVLSQGNATERGFPVFGNDLRICTYVPTPFDVSGCQVFWNGTSNNDNYFGLPNNASNTLNDDASSPSTTSQSSVEPSSSTSQSSSSSLTSSVFPTVSASAQNYAIVSQTVTITVEVNVATQTSPLLPSPTDQVGDVGNFDDGVASGSDSVLQGRDPSPVVHSIQTVNGTEVILDGFGWNKAPAVLDRSCLWALNFPVEVLHNTIREDIVFISFQFWVLGMSCVALLNESIPHILASLLTHMLATSWAAYQISHTSDFRTQFNRLITNGACNPINLLPQYWTQRGHAEIPILALNVLALLISAFLTWRLVKLFGWQTFKRVGASLTINRVYKIVLTLSITIQLSMFFMAATVGLWIDQLFNGSTGQLASLSKLYKGMFMTTLIMLIPWLMTGWFAVRRELILPMLVFLALCLTYMAGWAVMFLSTSFRWTFHQWNFFAVMAVASVVLTLATFFLGIVCIINFGKGLLRYLQAQEKLEGDDSTMPDKYGNTIPDPEKVNFPSRAAIPTFSVTFGSGSEVPPPSQMKFGPPRGHSRSKSQSHSNVLQKKGLPTHVKIPSSSQSSQRTQIERENSLGGRSSSEHSHGSNTYDGQGSNGAMRAGNAKRWIIE
jgi:hypothetical protein